MSSTPLVYPIRDLAIGKVGSTHPLERFPFATNGTSGHILTFTEEVGNLYSRPENLRQQDSLMAEAETARLVETISLPRLPSHHTYEPTGAAR